MDLPSAGRRQWLTLTCLLLTCGKCVAADLTVLPEFLRPDPFGGIVAADRTTAQLGFHDPRHPLSLIGARGGYVSFHLVVRMPEGGSYQLSFSLDDANRKLQADLFREWFHFTDADRSYYPDALIPASFPYSSRLPDPENRVEKQSVAAFWVDIWIPPDAVPGLYRGGAALRAGKQLRRLPIELKILPVTIPDQDAVTVDHNSYGSSWLAEMYPNVKVPSDESFRLTHLYHRIFYEHHGVFHQLGYGHGGKVIEEFAPALAGSGRTRRIASWDLYDRHYGPLFDGSAFAGSRRGPRPIPYVYLPINPEWPASFLGWGEPGYEVEFVNVVSAMERHFREKGWIQTRLEMFFNHKKRYKAFPWDGDEVRFPEDNKFFVEYGRLLKKALPENSPVKFVFRADASWTMEQQFRSLAGIVNYWVCGGGEFSWLDYAPKLLKGRGDIVWIYGSAPIVSRVSISITEHPLRAWIYGIDGWVHWLAVKPGEDPWYHFDGGGTALVYSGARFGVDGPIPSVRLKLQRNCIQDITLLDSFKAKVAVDRLKSEAAQRYNGTKPADWWTPRPALADTPATEWTNSSVDDAMTPTRSMVPELDAAAWNDVHRFVIELASEAK